MIAPELLHHRPEEHLVRNDVFMVNNDLGMRQQKIAQALDIPLGLYESLMWQSERANELNEILSQHIPLPIFLLNSIQSQQDTNKLVRKFVTQERYLGNSPLVFSFDPLVDNADLIDYRFHESRASLVTPNDPIVNLEHAPRGYVNRFPKRALVDNGAGKPREIQMNEMREMIRQADPTRLSVCLIEDTIKTGNSLIKLKNSLSQDVQFPTTLIATVACREAIEKCEANNIDLQSHWKFVNAPKRMMDISDILPSIGGRSIGWQREQNAPVIRCVGGINRMIPLGVDAIIGDYPWMVDIYSVDSSEELLSSLRRFSVNSAIEFWQMIESANGRQITWEQLSQLNGAVKYFYPINNMESSLIPKSQILNGPLDVLERIKNELPN